MNNDYAAKWSLDDAVEIKLKDKDDFLKICETLTRMGNKLGRKKKLQQICFILHKKNKYYLIHYKALDALDGDFRHVYDIEDVEKQNKIASLIDTWGLAEVVDRICLKDLDNVFVNVVPFKEKETWELIPMYEFGDEI